MKHLTLSALCLAIFLTSIASAKAAAIPPIREVKNVKPNDGAFKLSNATKPIEIRTEKEAAKHFDEKALAKLKKEVDLSKQIVLIFAWRGSGGDRHAIAIAESFPEQVFFSYKRGLTKDLRTHIKVYALRSNVKWRVR